MSGNEIQKKFYVCCFCNNPIESSYSDPCEIDILTNMTQHRSKQSGLIFYCHMECFREQLHEDIKMHFALECLIP